MKTIVLFHDINKLQMSQLSPSMSTTLYLRTVLTAFLTPENILTVMTNLPDDPDVQSLRF